MRVSVTEVDTFRYFLNAEDMTFDELMGRLRRIEPPTENMKAGNAFHKVLENAKLDAIFDAEMDGFKFRFDVEAELALPEIREIKALGEYVIDKMPVTLVGKVDALHGKRVYDHKLSSRFDAEKYADAFQWRAYLSLLECDKFTYNVFTGAPNAQGMWIVRALDAINFYRYPNMEADVEAELTAFVRFAKSYLPERLAA